MHLDIINYYRKDNPLFDIKVIDKSDLLEAIGYSYKSDIILYMMENYHYSYDEAETYLKFIQLYFKPNSPKLDRLKKLQDELEKDGYLFKSEVLKNLYLNKAALVIGYSKFDNELANLSNLLDMKLEYFEYDNKYQVNMINSFSRLEDEVYFVLNEIAHDIDLGVDINDIYIFNRSEEYLYYLKTFAPLFGYHINFPSSTSFAKTGVYSEFKKLYEESHNLKDALEELEKVCVNDDIYHQFVDVINKLKVDDLAYEIESVYLDKKLKDTYIEEKKYLKAVTLINEPTLLINKKVYIIGFNQGQFPKSGKDDSYLDEVSLLYLNKLTNKIKTKIDQERLLNFLKLNNELFISYSLKSLENTLSFVSPIAKELDLKEESNPFKEYFYSDTVIKYIACHLKDLNVLYKENTEKFLATKEYVDKEYLTYDNSFKGASVYKKDDHLRLSTSQLTNYASCPFQYYLGRILSVDPFEETSDSIFGNVVHKLLEKCLLDDSVEPSELYDSLIKESNVSDEIKLLWSLSLKDQILNMVRYLKKHHRYMSNPRYELERTINLDLDEYTSLTGRIDKLVILDNKYLVMVDYKTGSSGDFEEEYLKDGLSSQLPTYALLAHYPKYQKYTVSGLYINHIYTKEKDIEVKEDELIPKYLRLSGKSLDDYSSFFAFDNSIAGGKSSFVASISSKEETLISKSALVKKEELDKYIEIVKAKYLEVSELIRSNHFPIAPIDKGKSGSRACQYCTYRDICYVREKQVRYLVKEDGENNENV